MSRLLLAVMLLLLAACRGAGPHGFAATYAPTGSEETAIQGAREYDPVMYAREPDAWR